MKEKKLVVKVSSPAQSTKKFKRNFRSKWRGFKKNLIKRGISALEDKKWQVAHKHYQMELDFAKESKIQLVKDFLFTWLK